MVGLGFIKNNKKTILGGIAFLFVLAILGFFFLQWKKAQKAKKMLAIANLVVTAAKG